MLAIAAKAGRISGRREAEKTGATATAISLTTIPVSSGLAYSVALLNNSTPPGYLLGTPLIASLLAFFFRYVIIKLCSEDND
ncbi:MAG: hypothetical protein F6J98_01970 [Moorea sp. SIO4G2]|nr:hypothetical protein [Moorena sp. SIO4G2]